MATDFFQRQDSARRQTGWLIAAFVLAGLTSVLAIDVAVMAFFGFVTPSSIARVPNFFLLVSLLLAGYLGYACLKKSQELRDGGSAVALALGGTVVAPANADLLERRLLNVVDEMALAARVPRPKVFVLRQEAGINAFAAGHTPEDAAIAVTQGALQRLNREELQAVIGHEFSHVLNGDMSLNIRMIVWLHGLYAITALATNLIARRKERGVLRNLRLIIAAAIVAALGSFGTLIGRVLQAAVSRRRECLADASSVQFTRNPEALKNALLKIAGSADGAHVAAPAATGVAHLFFAGSEGSWVARLGSVFATHPTLAVRIKALDPAFDTARLRSLAAQAGSAADELAANYLKERLAPGAPSAAAAVALAAPAAGVPGVADAAGLAATAGVGVPAAASPFASRTGSAATPHPAAPAAAARTSALRRLEPDAPVVALTGSPAELLTLDTLQRRWPAAAQQEYHKLLEHYRGSAPEVLALVIALLLPQDLTERRPLLQQLARVSGGKVLPAIAWASNALQRIPEPGKVAALLALAPQIDMLTGPQRSQLLSIARYLCGHSVGPQLLRYAVQHVLQRGVRPPAPGTDDSALKLTQCTAEIGVLFQVLVVAGHPDLALAQRAYGVGLQALLPLTLRPKFVLPGADWEQSLDGALARLRGLHPVARKSLGLALAAAISVDGRLSQPESDLLRLSCTVIGMSLPALTPVPADAPLQSGHG